MRCLVRIQVAFLPQLAAREPAERGVCIVIDILRATTTLTTLLEYGAVEVLVAPNADAAREEKRRDPGALLLGEIGGLRPDDFDLGNSRANSARPMPVGGGRSAIPRTAQRRSELSRGHQPFCSAACGMLRRLPVKLLPSHRPLICR